ncbi:hypothetical protein LTR85_003340 [Meristemomyces frigidus]|nr:hypothetical protein LTR85_003340 [Meristemomyces frigidus]
MAVESSTTRISHNTRPRRWDLPWRGRPEVINRALGLRSIRLLRLSQGLVEAELEGRLRTFSLDDHPDYIAISYAWSDEHDRNFACLHLQYDETTVLPKSLVGALRTIRNTWTDCPALLWADQICINQEDVDDKNTQVSQMSEIYCGAAQVFIWLGDATEHDELAFWTAQCLAKHRGHATEASVRARWGAKLVDHGLKALETIWSRSWFGRLWVRQEIVFAQKATFFWGSHRMAASELFAACTAHERIVKHKMGKTNWAHAGDILAKWNLLNNASQLFSLIDQGPWLPDRREDVLDVLRFTFDQGFGVKHDRVYGIASMTSSREYASLNPNYLISCEEQFLQTAVYILTIEKSTWKTTASTKCTCPSFVLAIAAAQHRSKSEAMPSWVPDFASSEPLWPVKQDHYVEYSRKYSAGGKGQAAKFDPKYNVGFPRCLQLSGILISKLDAILADSQPPIQCARPSHCEDVYWHYIKKKLVPWYNRCRDFGRCDLADFKKFLHQGEDVGRKLAGPTLTQFRAMVPRTACSSGDAVDVNRTFADLGVFIAWSQGIVHRFDCRRVMTRSSDRHVGWVPEAAKEGDEVLLVQGAPFPFVVRRLASGRYKVVGDAYIDGIMHGESWKERVDEQTTVLIE